MLTHISNVRSNNKNKKIKKKCQHLLSDREAKTTTTKKSCYAEFKQHQASCAVSYTRQPLINSHHRVCAIATTKHRKSHLCTLTGVAVSLSQPNYFTVRELQVVLWDRGVLVIHSLMMTQVVVLSKLTVYISYCLLNPMLFLNA